MQKRQVDIEPGGVGDTFYYQNKDDILPNLDPNPNDNDIDQVYDDDVEEQDEEAEEDPEELGNVNHIRNLVQNGDLDGNRKLLPEDERDLRLPAPKLVGVNPVNPKDKSRLGNAKFDETVDKLVHG